MIDATLVSILKTRAERKNVLFFHPISDPRTDACLGRHPRGCGRRTGQGTLHRRRHDRVRCLGLDVRGRLGLRQRKCRQRSPYRQGANGDAGDTAERDALSAGRTDHLRLRRLEPMQHPSRSQADAECCRSHHGGDRRLETPRQDAAHRRGRTSGRGARLPPQAGSHRGSHRRRGDLRRLTLQHL